MGRHVNRAQFVCFSGCGATYELTESVTKCTRCGALLDVEQNLEALAERSGEEWKTLFDDRRATAMFPLDSGVWSKKEWVYPQLSMESIVSLGEGNSPLVPCKGIADELGLGSLMVKGCGVSHTGSFKDLGMTVLVSAVQQMRREGNGPRAIGCASTGDTSAALAAYAAAAGIPSVVILPRGKISPAQLIQPLASQSRVLSLDTDFDGCMALMKELAGEGILYLANSMNPLRLEGQKTAAIEIAQQLRWDVPDFVVLPGGNLGNVYAFGRGFQMMKELGLVDRVPRMVVAQAERANPLYRSFKSGYRNFEALTAGETEASAIRIGDPVSIHRAIRILKATDGLVMDANEDELARSAAMADSFGQYFDPHTGVAMAVVEKLSKLGELGSSARVVVVNTAHGLKFTEHKVRYHEGRLADVVDQTYRNQPIELDADVDAIRRLLQH